jgi:hypothetical protein
MMRNSYATTRIQLVLYCLVRLLSLWVSRTMTQLNVRLVSLLWLSVLNDGTPVYVDRINICLATVWVCQYMLVWILEVVQLCSPHRTACHYITACGCASRLEFDQCCVMYLPARHHVLGYHLCVRPHLHTGSAEGLYYDKYVLTVPCFVLRWGLLVSGWWRM